MVFYVSITGLELISEEHAPQFWQWASPAMESAKAAPGNIFARGARIQKTFHTLTIWENRDCMLRYMHAGPHANAMEMYHQVARSGKVCGYETDRIRVPSWDELRRIYDEHGRPMRGKKAQKRNSDKKSAASDDDDRSNKRMEQASNKNNENSSEEFAIAAN